jgi:hypothetical protein
LRYADDVVFILKPGDDPELLRKHIDIFLETRGLKVKEAKTKIVHSTDSFDNSTHQQIWTAEITDGEFLEMKTDRMPAWFKTAVWDKFSDI